MPSQIIIKLNGPSTITGLDWWTGRVDWTSGLTLKIILRFYNGTHLPVGLHDVTPKQALLAQE